MWIDEEAQKKLIWTLKRKNMLTEYTYKFGIFGQSPVDANIDHIRTIDVGSMLGTLFGQTDDLTASLARCEYRIIALGVVEPIFQRGIATNRYKVTIGSIGVYVFDYYDFKGDQPLGCWNKDAKTVGRNPIGATCIWNSDFRKWRKKFNAGGDFFVFSDMLYTKINPMARLNSKSEHGSCD